MNRPTPTQRASRIIEFSRVLGAPRAVVFDHFVEPDLIVRWWGPDGFTTPADQVEVDATVGGVHRKVMVLESAEVASAMGVPLGTAYPDTATVLAMSPPALLVLSSEPQPDVGVLERTVTRIEFREEDEDVTRVVVVEGPYDDAMAPRAETGWAQMFGKLERSLAG